MSGKQDQDKGENDAGIAGRAAWVAAEALGNAASLVTGTRKPMSGTCATVTDLVASSLMAVVFSFYMHVLAGIPDGSGPTDMLE